MQPDARIVETTTHGRYLVGAEGKGLPLLVGFHGYGESAEDEFKRLKSIEGSDRWITVAVQGLHRFYRRRTNDIVASWMTSQDREHAIADNLRYAARVLDSVCKEFSAGSPLVFSGFSQGASMAYRCGARLERSGNGVIALGGDVPPELDTAALSRIPAALIGRGVRDEWYTEEKVTSDEQRLRAAGVSVTVLMVDAGHEWTSEFAAAASRFIASFEAQRL